MFTITMGRGVRFEFPAVTVSIQWGPGNYCDNYNKDMRAPKQTDLWSCANAEVAVWDNSNQAWRNDYPHADDEDNVVGCLALAQVMDILRWAEQQA